jgi:hypothetical protein
LDEAPKRRQVVEVIHCASGEREREQTDEIVQKQSWTEARRSLKKREEFGETREAK